MHLSTLDKSFNITLAYTCITLGLEAEYKLGVITLFFTSLSLPGWKMLKTYTSCCNFWFSFNFTCQFHICIVQFQATYFNRLKKNRSSFLFMKVKHVLSCSYWNYSGCRTSLYVYKNIVTNFYFTVIVQKTDYNIMNFLTNINLINKWSGVLYIITLYTQAELQMSNLMFCLWVLQYEPLFILFTTFTLIHVILLCASGLCWSFRLGWMSSAEPEDYY